MKKNNLFLWVLFAVSQVNSQTSISSSGASITGSGGISSYTIGQLVYTTNNQNNGSIAQGVQQAFEFQILNNSEILFENLTLLTFPNPTSDNLVLSLSDTFKAKLEYTLFDMQGKQIMTGQISNTKTTIERTVLAKWSET